MNRYQFEDLISEYVENKLTLSKRKEFEGYMSENPDSKVLVDSIKENINKLNQIPQLKVHSTFNKTLLDNVETLKNSPKRIGNGIMVFGFTPLNASIMLGAIMAFIFISLKLINPNLDQNPIDSRNFVNNELNKESNTPTLLNNDRTKNIVDAKKDSIEHDSKIKKRKDFSNKLQFVND